MSENITKERILAAAKEIREVQEAGERADAHKELCDVQKNLYIYLLEHGILALFDGETITIPMPIPKQNGVFYDVVIKTENVIKHYE